MSEEAARQQALRLGAKLALPQTARTWSEREFRRNQWRAVTMTLAIYSGFCGLLLIGLLTDGESRNLFMFIAPVMLAGFALLAAAGVWRARRWPDYRDHVIMVGADDEGVTVTWQAREFHIPYRELRYRPHWATFKGNVQFEGISLTTPIGEQPLVDMWYQNGCKTAAAIVTAHDKWYLLERRG